MKQVLLQALTSPSDPQKTLQSPALPSAVFFAHPPLTTHPWGWQAGHSPVGAAKKKPPEGAGGRRMSQRPHSLDGDLAAGLFDGFLEGLGIFFIHGFFNGFGSVFHQGLGFAQT
jgi:hypothetical protein